MSETISVRVKRTQKKSVEFDGEKYIVSITELPVKGKANAAIKEILAEYFGVSKSQVEIVSGEFARNKIIRIG